MERKRFTPVRGMEYRNSNGSTYRCLSGGGIHGKNNAVLQCATSKWTFIAIGCTMQEDGTISWVHSIGGRYARATDITPTFQIEAYTAAIKRVSAAARKRLLEDAAKDPEINEAALLHLTEIAKVTV